MAHRYDIIENVTGRTIWRCVSIKLFNNLGPCRHNYRLKLVG